MTTNRDLIEARHVLVHVEDAGRPTRAPRPVPVVLRILARALRGGGMAFCSVADAPNVMRFEFRRLGWIGPGSNITLTVDPGLRPGEIEVLR